MANYNSFLFEGHGFSEVDGSYDPGASSQGARENDLVDEINKHAKSFLDKTSLAIHYDEQNYIDKDLAGNSYSARAGISVHINAGGGTGVEIYVPLNEKYLTCDFELVEELCSIMGIPNRGVRSRDFNSGATIQRTNGVAVGGTDYYKEIRDAWEMGISLAILEVGFIDSNDLVKIRNNSRRIGYAIAKYICKLCGVAAPAYDGSTTTQQSKQQVKPTIPQSNNGIYTVRVNNNAIYVLDGPSPNHNIVQTIYKNEVYTIVETRGNYGRLKSGAGWINLNYTTRL